MTATMIPVLDKKPQAGIACESDSIETVPLVEERSFAYWQKEIPEAYWSLTADEITERIASHARSWGRGSSSWAERPRRGAAA